MDTFCEIFKENSTGPVWVQTVTGSLVQANKRRFASLQGTNQEMTKEFQDENSPT